MKKAAQKALVEAAAAKKPVEDVEEATYDRTGGLEAVTRELTSGGSGTLPSGLYV